VLLDAQGREIVRVKQFGFVRLAPEFARVPPTKPGAASDAVATAEIVEPD
jgi:hypothetical protein